MTVYRCQHCPTSFADADMLRPDALRVAGWRIWAGETIGGQHAEVVICPACWGLTGVDDETQMPTGFDAECGTCLERASHEDRHFDGTEAAAEEWADEHQCDPDTRVVRPVRAATSHPRQEVT